MRTLLAILAIGFCYVADLHAGTGFTEWVEAVSPATGIQSNGTGFIVAVDGEWSYVATCQHIPEDCTQIYFGRNPKVPAELVTSSEPDDVAILRVKTLPKYEPCSWADAEQGPVDTYGYPLMSQVLLMHSATAEAAPVQVQQRDQSGNTLWAGDRREFNVVCHRGWSGGMVTQRGRCVGMVTASGGGSTLFTTSQRIRYHLTQCISGQCRQSYSYQQRYLYRPAFIPPAILPPRVDYIQTPIVQTEPTPAPRPAPAPVPVPPVVPSPPTTDRLQERLSQLESMVKSNAESISTLTETLAIVANREPKEGREGKQGPPGNNATDAQVAAAVAAYIEANPLEITVVVKDDGELVARHEGVKAPSVVTVPIKRTTVKK